MRCALLGPTPGSRPSSSIRSWTAPSYIGCSGRSAGRAGRGRRQPAEAAGERAHLLGGELARRRGWRRGRRRRRGPAASRRRRGRRPSGSMVSAVSSPAPVTVAVTRPPPAVPVTSVAASSAWAAASCCCICCACFISCCMFGCRRRPHSTHRAVATTYSLIFGRYSRVTGLPARSARRREFTPGCARVAPVRRLITAVVAVVAACALSACSTGSSAARRSARRRPVASAPTSTTTTSPPTAAVHDTPSRRRPAARRPPRRPHVLLDRADPAAAPGSRPRHRSGRVAAHSSCWTPATTAATPRTPPRSTAGLRRASAQIKACNTTGTETNAGYPEHAFNWDVALRVAGDPAGRTASGCLTRHNDTGVGPCVDERAADPGTRPASRRSSPSTPTARRRRPRLPRQRGQPTARAARPRRRRARRTALSDAAARRARRGSGPDRRPTSARNGYTTAATSPG